nr:MAG TPA: hypothetical protein [Caudoviricetes sp.]
MTQKVTKGTFKSSNVIIGTFGEDNKCLVSIFWRPGVFPFVR